MPQRLRSDVGAMALPLTGGPISVPTVVDNGELSQSSEVCVTTLLG